MVPASVAGSVPAAPAPEVRGAASAGAPGGRAGRVGQGALRLVAADGVPLAAELADHLHLAVGPEGLAHLLGPDHADEPGHALARAAAGEADGHRLEEAQVLVVEEPAQDVALRAAEQLGRG